MNSDNNETECAAISLAAATRNVLAFLRAAAPKEVPAPDTPVNFPSNAALQSRDDPAK